jgi:hypothetical protein
MWYRPVGGEGAAATWSPILPVLADWAVYAFVPWQHATAAAARYVVRSYHGGRWHLSAATIDQRTAENEWLRLASVPGETFRTDRPGYGDLTVQLDRSCVGCQPDQELGVDALLFIPAGKCDPDGDRS